MHHTSPINSNLFNTISASQTNKMATKFLLLALSLTLLVSSAFAERTRMRLSEQQQCRFQRINVAQPSQRIESEGGVTELWNEREDQFQCAGVAPMRNTLRPNGLSLPNYHPTPRLVFVERGQGFISITFPGCAETYHSTRSQREEQGQGRESESHEHGSTRDLHQKVHRIRRGDIIAIPAGAAHWTFNDGNEELVAVSINDLNHEANQLDQRFRAFYLAGGVRQGQQQEEQGQFQNIFRAFDTQLMSEAYNVPEEIIRKMQSPEQQQRGLIVLVRERMSFIRPDEQEQEREEQQYGGQSANGLEETFCTMKIRTNLENRKEADIYTRGAGKVVVADRHKLPILKYMDLSAERGNLYQNALLSPVWDHQGHTIVYVTRGDAQLQIVNQNGQTLLNNRVKQGDMFVIPQYHTSNARAGNNGYEWVSFKTTGWPMRSSVAGYTSVMRAMPLQVLTNAFRISPSQAQGLKMNRGAQSFLLSPGRRQSQRQY